MRIVNGFSVLCFCVTLILCSLNFSTASAQVDPKKQKDYAPEPAIEAQQLEFVGAEYGDFVKWLNAFIHENDKNLHFDLVFTANLGNNAAEGDKKHYSLALEGSFGKPGLVNEVKLENLYLLMSPDGKQSKAIATNAFLSFKNQGGDILVLIGYGRGEPEVHYSFKVNGLIASEDAMLLRASQMGRDSNTFGIATMTIQKESWYYDIE